MVLRILPQKKPHSKNTSSNRFSSFIPRKLLFCGLFCDLLANINYLLARSAVSTPAQSKIEFTAHLIKISSQKTVFIKCRKLKTQPVAATSFFAGEVEIYDFVTERAKRCIAAKRENGQKIFWKTYNDGRI